MMEPKVIEWLRLRCKPVASSLWTDSKHSSLELSKTYVKEQDVSHLMKHWFLARMHVRKLWIWNVGCEICRMDWWADVHCQCCRQLVWVYSILPDGRWSSSSTDGTLLCYGVFFFNSWLPYTEVQIDVQGNLRLFGELYVWCWKETLNWTLYFIHICIIVCQM